MRRLYSLVGHSRKERKVMQSHWVVGIGCFRNHSEGSFRSRILRGGFGGVGKGPSRRAGLVTHTEGLRVNLEGSAE